MTKTHIRTRPVAIVIAVVLAAVATVALFSYVRGVEAEALEQAEAVEVFVAKDVIPQGTAGDAAVAGGLISKAAVPRRNVVDGTITQLEDITGKVASVDILPGEQILAARFVTAENVKALTIPEGRQAMSVQVGIPPGVAGFIENGDRVSIVARLAAPGGGEGTSRVAYLLQNIEVLAVGQMVVTTTEEGTDGEQVQRSQSEMLMTLALTPQEVEKLAFAVFEGDIYFTLLPPAQKS